MILVFNLDYRSSSLLYEKIFLRTLEQEGLKGTIQKENFSLKLFVESDSVEKLEAFSDVLSKELPHSIFLHDSKAEVVEEMPEEEYCLAQKRKVALAPCPSCLSKLKESYNIFQECEVCGYGANQEAKIAKDEIALSAKNIQEGKIVEINTFYGKYFVGTPSNICNTINFDIMVYDLATVEKYTANVEKHEITALGAIEKPTIKLKKKIKFTMDFEEVEAELLNFRLADDAILTLLMEELHSLGIDVIFITKDRIDANEELLLTPVIEELEPIEIVASPKDILVVRGNKGLPIIEIEEQSQNRTITAFNSVVQEHKLKEHHENIAGVNFAKEYLNNIIVYGQKYGLVEYLAFNFEFNSIADIFSQIEADEKGAKLLSNYKAKFPEHCEAIASIEFEESRFNLYKLWGVVAIVLDLVKTDDPIKAAMKLEENALVFLGDKGPRIDYKLKNIDGKVHFDPLMTIRTAMSFRLAGVDSLGLSYGVIESFLEFIANELDELKQNMGVTAIVATGSLLANKKVFSKFSQEISVNHEIYFNNEMVLL